jgi:hypothetical protein
MRVMQIDDFLELTEGSGSGARAYDWARLVKEGKAARKAADGGAWRIGDLAGLVEHRYASGALKRFAEEIGESLGTVRRFRWVAAAYDEATRLRFSLSFSHFQAVASFDDRQTWLERAQRGAWSVDRLTTTARGANADPEPPHLAYKSSVEAVAKKISSLNEADDRLLAKAVRAGLGDAVEELTAQVERLRARLRKAQRRSMSVAR